MATSASGAAIATATSTPLTAQTTEGKVFGYPVIAELWASIPERLHLRSFAKESGLLLLYQHYKVLKASEELEKQRQEDWNSTDIKIKGTCLDFGWIVDQDDGEDCAAKPVQLRLICKLKEEVKEYRMYCVPYCSLSHHS